MPGGGDFGESVLDGKKGFEIQRVHLWTLKFRLLKLNRRGCRVKKNK